jgi:gliding motility-associated-like protein
MHANYVFGFTSSIYTYSKFSGYPSVIPNTLVPRTDWGIGAGGSTTMSFNKTVTNPVLLLSSLGSTLPQSARLDFSIPYVVLYDGGGMVYNSSTAITGTEGYAIIMFPGTFNSVTINSTTPETYTNITWGIRPQPFAIDFTDGNNNCAGAVVTASGGVTYKWNGGDTPNQATNTFQTSGTYLVTVTNAGGCITSASKTVIINPNPVATITGNTTACNAITLTASGGVTYVWNGGDTPNNATNTFHQSGTYTVTATNANGCSAAAPATVTVNPIPVITAQDIAITNGAVQAEPVVSGNISSYLWTPSTGLSNPTIRDPLVNPSANTIYTLTVTSTGGCTASAIINVTVPYTDIIIPNTFTPNGDGINDAWNIEYLAQYSNASIDIYNRYGKHLYHDIGYSKPWDGTLNGKQVPVGTYYYVIDLHYNSIKTHTGYVTIVR